MTVDKVLDIDALPLEPVKARAAVNRNALGNMRSKNRLLPSLLSSKTLVEQGKNFGDVELDVLQIKVILAVLLHLEQVIELEVKLQEASVTT